METAQFIAAVIGPVYVVVALSILFYMEPWQRLISDYEKNHLTYMPMAALSLVIGLLIINSYNVWESNVYVIVTIVGWVAFLKGVFYLLAPGSWTKSMIKGFNNKTWLILVGLLALIVGAVLSYHAYYVM